MPNHEVQKDRPMWIGQYDGMQYPFYGNISHLAIVHCEADWSAATIEGTLTHPLDVIQHTLDMTYRQHTITHLLDMFCH